MLTASELKRYAHLRRIKLIDHAWKDYLQDLMLYLLYEKFPWILFRGDTYIWKVMKGDRFSEDLDLCLDVIPKRLDEYLVKELRLFGFNCTILKGNQMSFTIIWNSLMGYGIIAKFNTLNNRFISPNL